MPGAGEGLREPAGHQIALADAHDGNRGGDGADRTGNRSGRNHDHLGLEALDDGRKLVDLLVATGVRLFDDQVLSLRVAAIAHGFAE